eukprot:jgi/Mesen1/2421/ME000157S01561
MTCTRGCLVPNSMWDASLETRSEKQKVNPAGVWQQLDSVMTCLTSSKGNLCMELELVKSSQITSSNQLVAEETEKRVKKRARKTNPGRRMLGGRIYDSEMGETCHWCRQKTLELHVKCSKPTCRVKFCGSCLRNRHGEEIREETEEGVLWVCPVCRGGCGPGCSRCCNCGPCRIKRKMKPTGLVLYRVRQDGFSNVHDWLIFQKLGGTPEAIAKRKEGRGWTKAGGLLLQLEGGGDEGRNAAAEERESIGCQALALAVQAGGSGVQQVEDDMAEENSGQVAGAKRRGGLRVERQKKRKRKHAEELAGMCPAAAKRGRRCPNYDGSSSEGEWQEGSDDAEEGDEWDELAGKDSRDEDEDEGGGGGAGGRDGEEEEAKEGPLSLRTKRAQQQSGGNARRRRAAPEQNPGVAANAKVKIEVMDLPAGTGSWELRKCQQVGGGGTAGSPLGAAKRPRRNTDAEPDCCRGHGDARRTIPEEEQEQPRVPAGDKPKMASTQPKEAAAADPAPPLPPGKLPPGVGRDEGYGALLAQELQRAYDARELARLRFEFRKRNKQDRHRETRQGGLLVPTDVDAKSYADSFPGMYVAVAAAVTFPGGEVGEGKRRRRGRVRGRGEREGLEFVKLAVLNL